jgi:hypothetical protein
MDNINMDHLNGLELNLSNPPSRISSVQKKSIPYMQMIEVDSNFEGMITSGFEGIMGFP